MARWLYKLFFFVLSGAKNWKAVFFADTSKRWKYPSDLKSMKSMKKTELSQKRTLKNKVLRVVIDQNSSFFWTPTWRDPFWAPKTLISKGFGIRNGLKKGSGNQKSKGFTYQNDRFGADLESWIPSGLAGWLKQEDTPSFAGWLKPLSILASRWIGKWQQITKIHRL